jgi:cation transport regulator ChaC
VDDGLWVFAYGSLIWRPDIRLVERVPCQLLGYRRAFAQGSTDHRGTPRAPGRVVTLLGAADAVCDGVAYLIAAEARQETLDRLDARESGGYVRHSVPLQLRDRRQVQALTYVAHPDNPNHLGEATLEALAHQVLHARGPSGRNLDYVLDLSRALRELGAHEPELFALEQRLLELAGVGG